MEAYLTKLQNSVKERFSQPALCDYEGYGYTYGELAAAIAKYHVFFREAGIEKGDKVALCGRNCAHWAMVFLAINTYGAIVVPILPNYTPEGIAQLVRHSDSVLLFTDKVLWDKLRGQELPAIRGVFCAGEDRLMWGADGIIRKAWVAKDEIFAAKYPDGFGADDVHYSQPPEATAIINYTSGTSGDPKGVMLPYRAMTDIVDYCEHHIQSAPDTILSMLPLAHIYGLAMEFVYPCCIGFTIYFLGKTPSPSLLMKAMQEVRPSLVITVPLVMEKIHSCWIKPQLSTKGAKALSTLPYIRLAMYKSVGERVMERFGGRMKTLIIGGAPLSWKVEEDLRRIGLPYTVGYGLTEGCPLLAYEKPGEFVAGSCGKPTHEIRIDSSDPERIPGEIQSRGPNLFTGYYKNPAADALAHTADGWFRTGDLGVMDGAGNLFIRGRIKALILSASGQNIYPEELEQVLSRDPLVEESLVIDRAGKIIALVYPAAGVIPPVENEEEVLSLCDGIRNSANKYLPAFSQIFRVELVDVPFERTAKGTIKRYLYQ